MVKPTSGLNRNNLRAELRRTNEALRSAEINQPASLLAESLETFLVSNLSIDEQANVERKFLNPDHLYLEEGPEFTKLINEIRTTHPSQRATVIRRAASEAALSLYNDISKDFLAIAHLDDEILEEAICAKLDEAIYPIPPNLTKTESPTFSNTGIELRNPWKVELHSPPINKVPNLSIKPKTKPEIESWKAGSIKIKKNLSAEDADKQILQEVKTRLTQRTKKAALKKEEERKRLKALPKSLRERLTGLLSRKKTTLEVDKNNNTETKKPIAKKRITEEGREFSIKPSENESIKGINSVDFELNPRDWKSYFVNKGLDDLIEVISEIQGIAFTNKSDEKIKIWEEVKNGPLNTEDTEQRRYISQEDRYGIVELLLPIIPELIKRNSPRPTQVALALLSKVGLALDNRGQIRDVG